MLWISLIAFVVLCWLMLRAFRSQMIYWGSTTEERQMPMPKTEKLKDAVMRDTHAITIAAPADRIWSYLMQIGQNRGGFYSYRWLENLVGCQMPKIEKIVPELQNLKLGDPVYLHPKAPPLTVTIFEKNKFLAFEGWYFALIERGPQQTRLITRSYDWRGSTPNSKFAEFVLGGVFFDFAHFIMERKMLLSLRRLAEARPEKKTNLWFRATAAWVGLFALAFINGGLREIVMKQYLQIEEPLAHQLSCLTGVVMWTAFTLLVWDRLRIYSLKKSVQVGIYWLVATSLFETFILNRNMSWVEILNTYNFLRGEFWGLTLLWIGLMPVVLYFVKSESYQECSC